MTPLPSPARSETLARRAHPLTGLTVALAISMLAFLLPGPRGPLLLYAVTLVAMPIAGVGRAIRQGLFICLPLWFFLFLLHGVLGGGPTFGVGPFALSRDGAELALTQAGRFGAIITVSLGFYHSFDASRFLNAAAAKRWPLHLSYLFVATLHAVPAFLARTASILEAQRARGLRFGGGPVARARAVLPLTLPLILGALAEVDERTHALDMRGVASTRLRTPLMAPKDSVLDRVVRWLLWLTVGAAVVWRMVG